MSDTKALPKGALRPAEAVVRSLIVDLGMIDAPDASFDDVLDPAIWANLANDLHVGDEVRVLAGDRSWERTVRILSTGPHGAVVEPIAEQRKEQTPRHLFVCRVGPDAPHMFTLLEREGVAPDFRCTRLMPGQQHRSPRARGD